MNRDELEAIFDRQASSYDEQWQRTAPIRDGLLLLVAALLTELPADAHILSVGSGTGEEIACLARRFPGWRFTAVEPSGAMLAVCRQKAAREGFAERLTCHEGYLETLVTTDRFDAALSFLVSQFILATEARTDFFRHIAHRLKPNGVLVSSDLAAVADGGSYDALLGLWQQVMAPDNVSPEGLSRLKATYARDVAVLPPAGVAAIIAAAGFAPPVQFFQAGLIHAWFTRKPTGNIADTYA
ncbi:MAG: class I SAM-dependent methyltransferase [Anaerolineales bacterium]|nr:class I SAM-dependent methyltransferase [Anaerolineales bacterium]